MKYLFVIIIIWIIPSKLLIGQNQKSNAINIYKIADSLYKAENEKSARDTLFALLPHFNEIKNDTLESKILALFGHLQKNIGNDTVSINKFMQSLSEKQINDYLGAIKAMGVYFFEKENYPKALSYYRKLLLFSANTKNKKMHAEANYYLGEVFLTMQNTQKAKDYLLKALAYAKTKDDSKLLINIYNRMGEIYRIASNNDSAIYYYTKTIEIAKTTSSPVNQIIANSNLSKIMEKQGNLVEALVYLRRAVNLAKMNQKEQLSQLYFDMANIYKNSGDINNAIQFYKISLSNADKTNNIHVAIESSKVLGKIYMNSNKALAASYLNRAIKQTDSLMKLNSMKELARYEAQYNLMQKEQEITLLDRDKKLNQAKLENQRFRNSVYFGGIIVLVILVGFLLYHISSRIKKNKILSAQNLKINEQNEELSQINQQLSESEQKLIQALSVKNKLFTIIGHDLKSPLIDIKNLIFILKSNAQQFSEDDLKGHTAQIENRLITLLELLNNLLNWGLTEKQALQYTPEKISINKLIDNTINLFEGQSLLKNLTFKMQVPDNQSWTTDHNMLEFTLRNIVSNAIKFSPQNAEIKITVEHTDKKLIISIKDNGIGMDNEQLSKIFIQTSDKVRRGTNNEKGTGLGMALAHEFTSQMNGKIDIKSAAGEGTIVSLILPENGQKV